MSKVSNYADSSQPSINEAKRKIASKLENTEGKSNAISSKVLAEHTGLKATTVRDLIAEVRREYNIPIASCPGGYYKIESKDDFQEQMSRIEETIVTKREHQRDLAKAFYNG